MMSPGRGAIGAAAAVALAMGTAALSSVTYTPDPGAHAAIRISWRARGERIERCRRLSPQELEVIPAHMRQETVCEGGTAPYRLRVTVDDTVRIDALVHGSGARRDRPLYVFHEIRLAPGVHGVRVAFTLSDTAGARPNGADEEDAEHVEEEAAEHGDRDAGANRDEERRVRDAARHFDHAGAEEVVPRDLALAATVTLEPRDLALITYRPESRQLELLTREADAP